ncbi:MAG: putative Rhomboid protease [Promethearchaeota archaeon]|nr:MAG: putative Rhomboid protease [Candidatus Lokiarchaeota archaeon]
MIILDAEDLKNAHISISLIFINIFMFIIFNMILPQEYLLLLLQNNLRIINYLEIWRLFTAMFLHGDAIHLFSNMVALLIFGAVIESNKYYSKLEYVLIYFISGLIGNLFSLVLLPPTSLSLGASGAIFGLIGAVFIIIITKERSLLFLALIYILYFVFSSFTPGTNPWAHIFGLLGGIGLGYLSSKIKDKKKQEVYY